MFVIIQTELLDRANTPNYGLYVKTVSYKPINSLRNRTISVLTIL